jgi:hypothetical protein
MSNLYRGPSIDASYQVSVHLAKCFWRRFLKIGQSEKELPVAAMYVNIHSDQSEAPPYIFIDIFFYINTVKTIK